MPDHSDLYIAKGDNEYIHYEVQQSAYAGKTRAYLRKKGIPFRAVLTAHPRYRSIVKEHLPRWRIPVLEAPDGTIVQDTTQIIDYLERLYPQKSVYPTTPRQRFVALLIEAYGDEGLMRAAMHYRWNFRANDQFMAREMARAAIPQAPLSEADDLGAKNVAAMRAHLPGLGIDDTNVQRVTEESYLDVLDILNEHFRLYPYLLGGTPSIGDFGLTVPLFAHLGRDPYPLTLMQNRAPFVFRWVERMQASDANMTEFPTLAEAFLADDEIPVTLIPLLKLIATEFAPQVEATLDGVERRAEALLETGNPLSGQPVLPHDRAGALGRSEITIRGVNVPVAELPITQWMFERSYNNYHSLQAEDKACVDELLKAVGLAPLYARSIKYPIDRVSFREVFA